MADDDVEETEETGEETASEETEQNDADDEPPGWFKKYLADQEAKKTPAKKTAPRPTKKTAPAKKTAPPAVKDDDADDQGDDKPKPRKRTGVSRAWFGSRAEAD